WNSWNATSFTCCELFSNGIGLDLGHFVTSKWSNGSGVKQGACPELDPTDTSPPLRAAASCGKCYESAPVQRSRGAVPRLWRSRWRAPASPTRFTRSAWRVHKALGRVGNRESMDDARSTGSADDRGKNADK